MGVVNGQYCPVILRLEMRDSGLFDKLKKRGNKILTYQPDQDAHRHTYAVVIIVTVVIVVRTLSHNVKGIIIWCECSISQTGIDFQI